jgi:hypothetical protein
VEPDEGEDGMPPEDARDFAAFLRSAPHADLDIERCPEPTREVILP